MHRAVRPAGGVLLTVPQHPWLWSNTDEVALHVRRYQSGELERKVQAAGFRILFSASYTALLLPLMAASRFRRMSKSDSLYREFELSALGKSSLAGHPSVRSISHARRHTLPGRRLAGHCRGKGGRIGVNWALIGMPFQLSSSKIAAITPSNSSRMPLQIGRRISRSRAYR